MHRAFIPKPIFTALWKVTEKAVENRQQQIKPNCFFDVAGAYLSNRRNFDALKDRL